MFNIEQGFSVGMPLANDFRSKKYHSLQIKNQKSAFLVLKSVKIFVINSSAR